MWNFLVIPYKTTVYIYAIVNGRITHKNNKYQKKGDITQHDFAKVSMFTAE